MKLVIVHSHFRPGGVRRVIELGVPPLVRGVRPRITAVVLVGGEAPDAGWLAAFQQRVAGVPVTCAIERAAGYASEFSGGRAAVEARLRALLRGVLGAATARDCIVWAHNLGLGRNLLLARELTRLCVARGLPCVSHHHDWWFDNRWQRWSEMRRAGFRSLAAVAETVFPVAPNVRHAAISSGDWSVLARHLGAQAGWLPNPAGPLSVPSVAQVRQARRWLGEQLGERAPVWIVPCRLLRRKNLAEAALLTRWLRPEAWLITTGGVSSADEAAYAEALGAAARRQGWRVRLGVLAGGESGKPTVPALVAASEAVLLTSLQEGFGLPNLEAAAAARPLIVRTLPNIAPDLARFGYRFPQSYDEVWIAPTLFDWDAERQRQEKRWREWRRLLPGPCRARVEAPPLRAAGGGTRPVAFSRLTLVAQLEVLAHDGERSWAACAPLNPFLARWRASAAAGHLAVSSQPRSAERWLGDRAYARNFSALLHAVPDRRLAAEAGRAVAEEFISTKLAGANQYPLLWSRHP